MRKSIAIGTSAAIAALFTHGIVFSAMYFKDDPLPMSTYQGFFQRIHMAVERLWSYAHGWQSMSHIRDFGRFYAPTIQLVCPLIGFALFWIISRHKVGSNFWKPVGIALLLTLPLPGIVFTPLYALGFEEQWRQAIRTLLIVLSMVWSVGAIAPLSYARSR